MPIVLREDHPLVTPSGGNLWKYYKALKTKISPKENVLPSTCREACQLLVELGIEYNKIILCKNDFILYRDEYQNKVEFPICK